MDQKGSAAMNESMKTILERRSIRQYKPEHVSSEELDYILQAGVYAPTSSNHQDTKFVIVRKPELLAKISRMNAAVNGAAGDPFYGAPDLIIVFADSNLPNWKQDGALAMGNMMNMAKAQGIGSCWINRAYEVFETEEGRALAREWGLPESYKGGGNMILGYPDCEDPKPSERKPDRFYFAE